MIYYFGMALIVMETDAMLTVALKKKYNVLSSFCLSLIWPVTALCVIYYAATNKGYG